MARRVRAWDLAATEAGGDYTCGVKMARSGNLYYIEDVVRGRWSPMARDQIIDQTAHADGRAVEIVIEQEGGSGGLAQVAALIQLLAGFKVSGRRSTGDKVTRAGPLASQCEAGNVKIVSGPFIGALLDEMSAFPSDGVHDDQVDACSLAFLVLSERVPGVGGYIGQAATKGGWLPRRGVF